MKDQKAILHRCLKNDEPAFVIAGHDSFAIETMEAYKSIAEKHGAEEDFLNDMQLVIDEMKQFQEEEPEKVRIPKTKHERNE